MQAGGWTTRLPKAHVQRRFASLPSGPKRSINALQAAEAPGDEHDATQSPKATADPVMEKLNLVCAALEKFGSRGRSPVRDPKDKPRTRSTSSSRNRSMPDRSFKGCWHCGEEGHSRTTGRGKHRKPQCPKLKEYLQTHGSKLPDSSMAGVAASTNP